MTARNTGTGKVFEATVVPALELNGYDVKLQVLVGTTPNGKAHYVDAVVTTPGANPEEILVSNKWQQSPGTAEQKVPYEVIRLLHTMNEQKNPDGTPKYARAYLILGGDGWTLRDYFQSGELAKYITGSNRVKIVTTDRFLALANKKAL